MNRIAANILAIALMGASPVASAGVCDRVRTVAAGAGVGVGVSAAQAALAVAPVNAVAHSSGSLILSGSAGYLGNTLGLAASTFAFMTAPVTIVAVAGTAVAAGGVVAYCLATSNE